MSTRALLDDPLPQTSSPNTVERILGVVALGSDVVACGSNLNRINSAETAFCLRLDSSGIRVTSWGVSGILNVTAFGDPNESNIFSSVIFDSTTDRLILVGKAKVAPLPVFLTLVCVASAGSGNIINCTRTFPKVEKDIRRAALTPNGTLVVSEVSDGSLFVVEYSPASLALIRVIYQAAGSEFLGSDMAFAARMIHISFYTIATQNVCQVLSILPNGTNLTMQLPSHPDGCTVTSMAVDDMNRVVLGGTWGNSNFSNPKLNEVALWRIDFQGGVPQMDTTFGNSSVLTINNTHGAFVFVTRLVYDQTFRLVIFARVLRNFQTNDNDILVYRRYTRDGKIYCQKESV